jgi:1-acyl-sn-glycerol-3-phosphate acyltransferase
VKAQKYIDPRPAEHFDKYHRRVRERGPDYIYPLARMVLTGPVWLGYRARAVGVENVPERGPVILAPNHFSNLDHFFLALFLRRQVQFMAKSQLFRFPINFILSHGGAFPVRRGQHDDEAFVSAHAIFRQGGVIAMYAEGGRSRSKQVGKPKPGLGRLALESGVPVTPVAIHGSEHARELRLPKVTIQYGEQLFFERVERPTREQCDSASRQVFERVRQMYEALNAYGRKGVLKALRSQRSEERPAPLRPHRPGRAGSGDATSTARFEPTAREPVLEPEAEPQQERSGSRPEAERAGQR